MKWCTIYGLKGRAREGYAAFCQRNSHSVIIDSVVLWCDMRYREA